MADQDDTRILRLPEVITITGLSASSLRREEKAGRFPRRRRLAPGTIGFLASEVTDWVRSREPVDSRK